MSAHGLQQEIIINEHIKKTASLHAGRDALHIISEAFELNTDRSKHYCLLSAPVQMTLDDLLQNAKAHDASLDLTILRVVIHRLLLALSYLHDEAGVLHTDLKPDNIFLSLKDYAALSKFEDEERRCPSFRKNIDERLSIYQSRAMPLPKEAGVFQLGDFGQAIVVDKHPTCMQDIQPPLYRAPEVVMRTQWSLKADVWNLGCLVRTNHPILDSTNFVRSGTWFRVSTSSRMLLTQKASTSIVIISLVWSLCLGTRQKNS